MPCDVTEMETVSFGKVYLCMWGKTKGVNDTGGDIVCVERLKEEQAFLNPMSMSLVWLHSVFTIICWSISVKFSQVIDDYVNLFFRHDGIQIGRRNLVALEVLTHWGRVGRICVSKLTIIGSDNGLSPERRQAVIWTNAGTLLIGNLGTNFSEILSELHTLSFKKMYFETSSAKRRPFCLGLNVLKT